VFLDALNQECTSTTGFSPYSLVFGQNESVRFIVNTLYNQGYSCEEDIPPNVVIEEETVEMTADVDETSPPTKSHIKHKKLGDRDTGDAGTYVDNSSWFEMDSSTNLNSLLV